MKGMHGRCLELHLTSREARETPLDEDLLQDYLGGRGLGVKLFSDRVPPGLDPLSADNLLVFATGPVTATTVPTSGRLALVTKSPLTGTIFYSNSGGFFGNTLKRCGYDVVIVSGALQEPGYVVVDGQAGVRFEPAGTLWGKDTRETMAVLHATEGKRAHAVMIGPAGEHQVPIAAIMNDGDHRAFGRGGVGAVMGSKRLKALVVTNGTQKTEIHDPASLKAYVTTARDKIKVVPITRASLPHFGTAGLVNVINELGMFPVRNFQRGHAPEARAVSGEAIRDEIFQEDEGCYACPIRCGRLTRAGDMEGKGPEYESVWALGPDCGVFDLVTVTQANYWCNLYGLDTISTGATIACAMELQQRGLLDAPDLHFGNGAILRPLIEAIAYRRDVGADLAGGARQLATKHGALEVAIHVKGLELPAYDPRGALGHALGYATSNRGGCHLTGYMAAMEIFMAPKRIPRFTTGGKADLLVLKQNQSAVEDSLVLCKFAGWALGFDFYSRFAMAITGEDLNITRLMETGERIYNLERLYNLREGLTSADDALPRRFLETSLTEGFSKGVTVPLADMLRDYYFVRKWDADGVPTREKLAQLGLNSLEPVPGGA